MILSEGEDHNDSEGEDSDGMLFWFFKFIYTSTLMIIFIAYELLISTINEAWDSVVDVNQLMGLKASF